VKYWKLVWSPTVIRVRYTQSACCCKGYFGVDLASVVTWFIFSSFLLFKRSRLYEKNILDITSQWKNSRSGVTIRINLFATYTSIISELETGVQALRTLFFSWCCSSCFSYQIFHCVRICHFSTDRFETFSTSYWHYSTLGHHGGISITLALIGNNYKLLPCLHTPPAAAANAAGRRQRRSPKSDQKWMQVSRSQQLCVPVLVLCFLFLILHTTASRTSLVSYTGLRYQNIFGHQFHD